MEAWVIKRKDGMYFCCETEVFHDSIWHATFYPYEPIALEHIKYWQLKNCELAKVRIALQNLYLLHKA